MFVVRRAVTFNSWNTTNVVPCVCSMGTDTSVGAGGTLSLGWVSFFSPTDRQCMYTSHDIGL